MLKGVPKNDREREKKKRNRKEFRKCSFKHIKAITVDYLNGGRNKHINGIIHGQ